MKVHLSLAAALILTIFWPLPTQAAILLESAPLSIMTGQSILRAEFPYGTKWGYLEYRSFSYPNQNSEIRNKRDQHDSITTGLQWQLLSLQPSRFSWIPKSSLMLGLGGHLESLNLTYQTEKASLTRIRYDESDAYITWREKRQSLWAHESLSFRVYLSKHLTSALHFNFFQRLIQTSQMRNNLEQREEQGLSPSLRHKEKNKFQMSFMTGVQF